MLDHIILSRRPDTLHRSGYFGYIIWVSDDILPGRAMHLDPLLRCVTGQLFYVGAYKCAPQMLDAVICLQFPDDTGNTVYDGVQAVTLLIDLLRKPKILFCRKLLTGLITEDLCEA